MSQYEILPLIEQGLNGIINNSDLEDILKLYKLSILIKKISNEDYIKLFAINYINYYKGRMEFIKGIKSMNDTNLEEIRNIMINNIDLSYNQQKNKEKYRDKYLERRQLFLNLTLEEFKKLIIEEHLNGINSNEIYIENLINIIKLIDINELSRLNKINIDLELVKLKDKIKYKYTEEGNFEDDEEILKIIINNISKKGYTSHHLHIYVYEEIDKIVSKLFVENSVVYQKNY